MERTVDLAVIGAGPGGYVAAIKAAKLGFKTVIVEKDAVGGTCLNRGCIPTKALLEAARTCREATQAAQFGIQVDHVQVQEPAVWAYETETVQHLVQGIEGLLKANHVEVLTGQGQLCKEHQVQVTGRGEPQILKADNVLLATGSTPVMPSIPGMDAPGVVNSDQFFQQQTFPKSLIIIGGGVIGVELAEALNDLGVSVTILEALPRLLSNMDLELSRSVQQLFKKRGILVHTSASVQEICAENGQLTCVYTEENGEKRTVYAEQVLCAVGRAPKTEHLFATGVTPRMEQGKIWVDETRQTSLPHVYAIGDVIPGVQLAHRASAEGMVTAERLAGQTPSLDLSVIPSCVYLDPEIASVGLNAEEAKAQGLPVKTGKFLMSANGKSQISREERGFIKVVARADTEEILGAQLLCARASDMVGEFVTAISNHLTVSDLLQGVRAHPTYNEGIGEALEELEGGAIHALPRRKG